jgi:hypothetical protein
MELIAAMYIAAWLIQLWTLFVPVLENLPKDNYVNRYKILCYIVLIFMTFFLVLFLLPAMLDDISKERFKISFRKGLLGE